MPTIAVSVPDGVGDALSRQARVLLLGRRQYIRSRLAVAKADPEARALAGYLPAGMPQVESSEGAAMS